MIVQLSLWKLLTWVAKSEERTCRARWEGKNLFFQIFLCNRVSSGFCISLVLLCKQLHKSSVGWFFFLLAVWFCFFFCYTHNGRCSDFPWSLCLRWSSIINLHIQTGQILRQDKNSKNNFCGWLLGIVGSKNIHRCWCRDWFSFFNGIGIMDTSIFLRHVESLAHWTRFCCTSLSEGCGSYRNHQKGEY